MQRVLARDWGSRVGVQGILVALSVLGVGLVLLCTSRYGAGVSPDSTCYISAARNLLAGTGYCCFDGKVYSQWPPLFPTAMAAFGLVGIEPQTSARFLNAFAFGLLIFVSGRMFLRCTTSLALAVLGTLSIVLSAPLIIASAHVWSEAVFILLAALFVLFIADFLRAKSWRLLTLISVLAALACLQRYVGVTLILAGGVLILLCTARASLWERVKYLAGFGAMSGAPLAAWVVRNRLVAGDTAGAHHFHLGSVRELGRSAAAAGDVMAAWFLPERSNPLAGAAGLALIVLSAGAAVVLARRVLKERDDLRSLQIRSVVVYGLVFVAFLIVSGAGLMWNPDGRVLLPAYVFLMLLAFAGIDAASRVAALWIGKWPAMGAGLLFCSLWLFYHPFGRAVQCIEQCVEDGVGYYCSRTWMESQVLGWLREHPLSGTIYSNAPDAMYALTGLSVKGTPLYLQDTSEFAGTLSASDTRYVVWLGQAGVDYLYDLRELRSRWRMAEIATFPDGAVYQVLGDGDGLGLFGVSRFWRPQEGNHFYVLDRREAGSFALHARQWRHEGIVFYVYPEWGHPADASPVHRFWSDASMTWFYTISEEEKEQLVQTSPHIWRYGGIAWYAYPEGRQPADCVPVHRFWCGQARAHFYTISEAEKDALIQKASHVWTYEGVVWYAYGK